MIVCMLNNMSYHKFSAYFVTLYSLYEYTNFTYNKCHLFRVATSLSDCHVHIYLFKFEKLFFLLRSTIGSWRESVAGLRHYISLSSFLTFLESEIKFCNRQGGFV